LDHVDCDRNSRWRKPIKVRGFVRKFAVLMLKLIDWETSGHLNSNSPADKD
jgi:hypothetical protein